MTLINFAKEWIEAWNTQHLDRILSLYSDQVIFTSPKALARLPHTEGTVRGIEELRQYWAPVADLRPDLHFSLERVLETVNGCTILYHDENGLLVAETMLFDTLGKVCQGIVSHAIP